MKRIQRPGVQPVRDDANRSRKGAAQLKRRRLPQGPGRAASNRSRKGAAQLKPSLALCASSCARANRSRKGAAQLKLLWRKPPQ